MEIRIRAASSKDIPVIRRIINHEIRHSTVTYNYTEKSLEELEKWFNQKQANDFPLLVAEQENKVLGYATYDKFRAKEAYRFTIEHSVYIAEEGRGQGIGKLLMKALIKIAQSKDYHLMVAGIDTSNSGSYEFHKSLGFEEVGVFREVGYKFDRWLDLRFMQLFLSEKTSDVSA